MDRTCLDPPSLGVLDVTEVPEEEFSFICALLFVSECTTLTLLPRDYPCLGLTVRKFKNLNVQGRKEPQGEPHDLESSLS